MFLSMVLAAFLVNSSFATTESEPNDECLGGNIVSELEGVYTHTTAIFKGETRSKGLEPGTNKPDYDRDYFDFTPAKDGIIKVKFNSTGFTNFFIGVPTCRWNITSHFGSQVDSLFYAKAGERVNILAMCRHPRNYQTQIEYIPIKESDSKPKVSIKKAFVTEGDGGMKRDMIFTISLDKPSSSYVGVEFKTYDIGAKAGKDYESVDKRVVFSPGEVKKEVAVPVIGDDEKEQNEVFEVKLEKPLNADIVTKSVSGMIIDDDKGYVIPSSFDIEPNSDCVSSELISELEGVDKPIKFKAKGVVDPTYEDDGEEGRDYYHFTPAVDGNITIELDSKRATWFTIGTKGCALPWEGDRIWNIQRGTTANVNKSFIVKKGERVDILALSYDRKEYALKVEFTPISKPLEPKDNLQAFIERLYKEILKRDADEEGLEYWEKRLKEGDATAEDLARYFFDSKEFKSQNISDEEFVNRAYETLLGRSPDKEGYDFWVNKLKNGSLDRDKVVDMFIDSPEFRAIAKKYGIKANRLSY